MLQYLNKKIPTRLAIVVILVLSFLLVGEIFWQYSEMQKEIKMEIPKANI